MGSFAAKTAEKDSDSCWSIQDQNLRNIIGHFLRGHIRGNRFLTVIRLIILGVISSFVAGSWSIKSGRMIQTA
jgi:hypothetical protein